MEICSCIYFLFIFFPFCWFLLTLWFWGGGYEQLEVGGWPNMAHWSYTECALLTVITNIQWGPVFGCTNQCVCECHCCKHRVICLSLIEVNLSLCIRHVCAKNTVPLEILGKKNREVDSHQTMVFSICQHWLLGYTLQKKASSAY